VPTHQILVCTRSTQCLRAPYHCLRPIPWPTPQKLWPTHLLLLVPTPLILLPNASTTTSTHAPDTRVYALHTTAYAYTYAPNTSVYALHTAYTPSTCVPTVYLRTLPSKFLPRTNFCLSPPRVSLKRMTPPPHPHLLALALCLFLSLSARHGVPRHLAHGEGGVMRKADLCFGGKRFVANLSTTITWTKEDEKMQTFIHEQCTQYRNKTGHRFSNVLCICIVGFTECLLIYLFVLQSKSLSILFYHNRINIYIHTYIFLRSQFYRVNLCLNLCLSQSTPSRALTSENISFFI
jgi:hypothetical protein